MRRLGSAREIAPMDAIDGHVANEVCCLNPERRPLMRARQTIPRGLASLLFLLGMACSSEQSDVEHPRTAPEAGPLVTAPAALRNTPAPGGTPAGAVGSCTQDADCPSSFCDRGICAKPIDEEHYGDECEPSTPYALLPPPPPLPPGQVSSGRRSFATECAGYLCVEGRCRSCQSDDECKYWVGAPFCVTAVDYGGPISPGKGCWSR
jgi:hypothetical protein